MPSNHEMVKKMECLEAQVDNERKARENMERQVRELKSELGSQVSSQSRCTSIA